MNESKAGHCPYCSSLKTIVDGNNYCSIHAGGQQNESSAGNAFYVKTNRLKSKRHISRLTFRTVLEGYQYYKVDDHEHMIKKNNYLIVNKGQSYYNEIDSEKPVESLIVAFQDSKLEEVGNHASEQHESLLDNPDHFNEQHSLNFEPFKSTYELNPNITKLTSALKKEILSPEKDHVRYEELQYALLEELMLNHVSLSGNIDRIQTTRKSTQIELYQRISTAKDYMDAHFNKKLSLEKLGQVATLSPYHFLRSFKKMFGLTPWEYLTKERLDHSRYLLKYSDMEIKDIILAVGYDNASSFSRLFKSYFKMTPLSFRKLKSAR